MLSKYLAPEPVTPSYTRYLRIGDITEIGNGMVSGLDAVFKIEDIKGLTEKERKSILQVSKAKSLSQYITSNITHYFFIEEGTIPTEEDLQSAYPNFYTKLINNKEKLQKRWTPYPKPWWEWAFPRNKRLMEQHTTKIFVPCKDRFDSKGYVRFAVKTGPYYANQDVTVIVKHHWVKESYEYLVAYLNSKIIFRWLKNKGLRRGGVLEFSERPLASIPVRLINWSDEREVDIHDVITKKVKDFINNPIEQDKFKQELEEIFETLLFSLENDSDT